MYIIKGCSTTYFCQSSPDVHACRAIALRGTLDQDGSLACRWPALSLSRSFPYKKIVLCSEWLVQHFECKKSASGLGQIKDAMVHDLLRDNRQTRAEHVEFPIAAIFVLNHVLHQTDTVRDCFQHISVLSEFLSLSKFVSPAATSPGTSCSARAGNRHHPLSPPPKGSTSSRLREPDVLASVRHESLHAWVVASVRAGQLAGARPRHRSPKRPRGMNKPAKHAIVC